MSDAAVDSHGAPNGTAAGPEHEQPELAATVTPSEDAAPEQPVEPPTPEPESKDEQPATAAAELTEAEKLAQKHAEGSAESAEAAAPEEQKKPAEKPKSSRPVIESQEDFPALGGPPKTAAAAPQWGAKSSTPTNNNSNETAANGPAISTWAPAIAIKAGGQLTFTMFKDDVKTATEMTDRKIVLAEVIKDVQKKTGTKIEGSKFRGDFNFVVSAGTEASRLRAKKEITRALAKSGQESLTVPALIRPHIIGKQGSKVQELQNKTFTNIKVPPPNPEDMANIEHEDEATIQILIEGDSQGRREAIALINALVAERVGISARSMIGS